MAIGDGLAFELRRVIESMPGAMKNVADVAIQTIKQRTRSGLDLTGKPFIPYGERWRRDKEGRGTYAGFANLIDTERMIEDIGFLNRDFTNDRQVAFDPRLGGAGLRDVPTGQTAGRNDVQMAIGPTTPRAQRLAAIHTSGNYGRGPRKPRPFIGITEAENGELFRVFRNRLHTISLNDESTEIRVGIG